MQGEATASDVEAAARLSRSVKLTDEDGYTEQQTSTVDVKILEDNAIQDFHN